VTYRLAQVATAARYAILTFRRNPAGTFFTIVLPVIFLVMFGSIFGDERTASGAKVITFQVPGIVTLSVVSATFVNLAMTATYRRELGQLKRIRSTPMPPAVYILGQVAAAFVIVAFMAVLMIVIGRLIFGVTFNFETLPVFAVSLVIATVAFSALGLAVTAIIPSQDAAPAITNFIVLPLYFVSDVFIIYDEGATGFIKWAGDIFPVKHLAHSIQDSFNPFVDTVVVPWGSWAVMGAWGVAGVIIASLTFRWTPRRSA